MDRIILKSDSSISSRSSYLENKTELTDEDIINILDLPVEKPDYTKITIITDKSFSKINSSETELHDIKEELLKQGDFLKYHESYISKTKLLYTETRTLYNELAGILVLNEIKMPAYLLPYGFARKDNKDLKFSDALKLNDKIFTEFKRSFSCSFERAYKSGNEQGEEIFISLNVENNKDIIFKQLKKIVNGINIDDKSCSVIFYTEKNRECFWYEINKNGYITEKELPSLKKENRLAYLGKPSAAENLSENKPSTSINITPNTLYVNNIIFETLLERGAAVELRRNKDIKNRYERYIRTISNLENITTFSKNLIIKNSNNIFIQSEKQSQFYKNINKNIQGVNTMSNLIINYKSINASQVLEDFSPYLGTSKEMVSGMLNYLYYRSLAEKAVGHPENQSISFYSNVSSHFVNETNKKAIIEKLNEYDNIVINFDYEGILSYAESINQFDKNSPGDLVKELDFYHEAYDYALINTIINTTEANYKNSSDVDLRNEYYDFMSRKNSSDLSKEEWLFSHSDYFKIHYPDIKNSDKVFIKNLLNVNKMSEERMNEWNTYSNTIDKERLLLKEKEQIIISKKNNESISDKMKLVPEEEMTFTDKNIRSILLDYCEPYVKTAYYKELFGEEKKEFTDNEIRKLSKFINIGDLLNTLDEKSLRDFAKDTGIPVSSDYERQKKLIVEGIKRLQKQENEQYVSEQNNKNYDEIVDSGIESVQANGGLSEAAMEAEMVAQEAEEELFYEDFDDDYDDNYSESEYLDPQGNDTRYDELSDLEDEIIEDESIENPSEYLSTHDETVDIEKEAYQEYLLTPEGKSSLASQEEAAIENENRQNEIAQAEEEFEKTGVLSKEPPKQPDPMFQRFADKHAFFVENAYVENTPIPSFGFRNAKTGHIVIMSGWEFSHTKDPKDPKESYGVTNSAIDKFREKYRSQFILDKDGQKIENPDYNPYVYKNKSDIVVLQKKTENGEHIKMEIPAEQYAQMILNSCLVKDAASAEKNIEEYRQKAQLDENEQRKNTAENFTHNFTAFCRKGANNVQEAMDFAVRLLQDMRPEEREKTKAQMLSWEKQSGISYTQRLNQEYQDSVSDKPIVDKTHFAGTVLDAVRRNTEVITLEGSKLDKNCKLKVGESINMEIAISDCLGRKKQKLPKQKMVLVSHSPDSNAVVLMDEKGLSKYVLPRDEFIKNVQKYEKKQEKNNNKENFISMSD